MFRTVVMFPKTDEGHFAMTYFLDRHLPLVAALLSGTGLLGTEVEEGVVLEPPGPAVAYGVMASLTFNSLEALERAMVTYGAELRRDLHNFTFISLRSMWTAIPQTAPRTTSSSDPSSTPSRRAACASWTG